MANILANRFLRFGLVLICLSFLFVIVYYYFYLLFPFLLATIITLCMQPIVTYIEVKCKLKRIWSSLLVLASFISILALCVFFLSKVLLKEAITFLQHSGQYLHYMKEVTAKLSAFVDPFYQNIVHAFVGLTLLDDFSIQSYADELMESMMTAILSISQAGVRSVGIIIQSFTQMIAVLFFVCMTTFIMLVDYENLKERIIKHIPYLLKNKLFILYMQLKKSFLAFLKAQIIITFYTACLVWLGLFLFRIEQAFLIALFVFIIDFFPYVGAGILFVPWIVYAFIMKNYILTIQLPLLYMAIILFRQVAEPKIVGQTIGLHPLVTIFVLFFGFTQFGIIGVLLTPFLLIFISAIYHAKIIPSLYTYIKDGR